MPRSAPLLVSAVLLVLVLAAGCATVGEPAPAGPETAAATTAEKGGSSLPSVAEATAGMERRAGLLDLYVDRDAGAIWLALPPPRDDGEEGLVAELLYVEGLVQGLGSNPVGLDRGQIGATRLVRIRRLGPQVLIEEPNLRFRAVSEDPEERLATAQSFATSVLWGGEIGALDADGRALVDFTSFVVRDAHGVTRTLTATEQGSYALDATRSAPLFDSLLAFPDNLELEAVLTFAGEEPGEHLQATAPMPQSITLVQHHSLVRLPDDGYTPRLFHPSSGFYAVEFLDYAAPLAADLERRYIVRHRLERTDPTAPRSPVAEPIVFYVDRGVPEPVRSALVEGASWWADAFAAAGLEDAYRVELLPAGVHPLDVRYHVIQWVHRSTRGWSYGGGVIDPRTGEMIKGHVNLGSLRVRQDRLLFEGLAGTAKTGSGDPDDPVELALARIRQLSAHEVGHALGLTHNFAASTYGDRASVMDYPAPLVTVGADGTLDFSRAYGVGVGAWDVAAIRYGYAAPPPGTGEAAFLADVVDENRARGYLFITDADARPAGAAEPRANLWDNLADPVDGLELVLAVRERALADFGVANVAADTPLARLQEVLVPLYFHHRYQLEAAAKVVGGLEYSYARRGEGDAAAPPSRIVDAARQRRALAAVAGVLDPAVLDLPEEVLALLLPRAFSDPPNREMFVGMTGPTFDPLSAAASAAQQVVELLLQPERLQRVIDYHRRHPELPDVAEVVAAIADRAFDPALADPRHAELLRTVQRVAVDHLIDLAGDPALSPAVRARLEEGLRTFDGRLARERPAAGAAAAHVHATRAEIARFLDRDFAAAPASWDPPPLPPGSPIGGN